jgi:UrcA family protein
MTTTKFARTTVLLAVASGLLAMTAPAFAQSDDAVPQGKLNVAGTDFTSAKAVDHLKARVRRLAFEICVPNGNSAITMAADERKCYETAVNNGLAEIASKQQQALRATTVDVASAQTETHSSH